MSHAHGGAARVVVVTVSDRCAAGERVDESGPAAADAVRAAGLVVRSSTVVPDGVVPVRDALRDAIAAGADVILTLGGTGVGPRDRTPEATREGIEMELPGIAEAIRANGRRTTPTAAQTRKSSRSSGFMGERSFAHRRGVETSRREYHQAKRMPTT